MYKKHYTRNFVTKESVELIHEKSLHLLKTKGIRFSSEELLELFKERGLKVDGEIVYFTEEIVNEALASCPRNFTFVSRGHKLPVGTVQKKTIGQSSLGPINVLKEGEHKPAQVEDYTNLIKLFHTSDVIDMIDCELVYPQNVPTEVRTDFMTLAPMMYSDKPIAGLNGSTEVSRRTIQLAKEFNDIHDQVLMSTLITSAPPFAWDKAMCESLIEYAKNGQCCCIAGVGLAGLTGPPSLAGNIIQNNTERLAGIVATQVVNPGAPVIYQFSALQTDLRYSLCVCGGAEVGVEWFVESELANFYGLPKRSHGCLSDAKEDDYQSGRESAFNGLSALMSEPEVSYMLAGIMDSFNTFGYEKFILDEETYKVAARLLRPVDFNEETMLMAKMEGTEHSGNYIARTTKTYRNDFMFPEFANRKAYSNWSKEDNSISIQERATQAWKKRLEEYVRPELDSRQIKMIEDLLPAELRFK
ncbi:trimethylamine methyltransferase family protein [Alkalibacter mobilis]|uniref:trimethylamine methyltransferase family protein n=1 Tax=Alkalibacter mobilis TaxID=2787712 RepID=UPI00189C739D|nr:trimethylamine methyltransferase family protein [Alkalibacter mobilis]MBF7095684.1 trimethylamine methyltransferase family protein [Alkalibacter mobilis]